MGKWSPAHVRLERQLLDLADRVRRGSEAAASFKRVTVQELIAHGIARGLAFEVRRCRRCHAERTHDLYARDPAGELLRTCLVCRPVVEKPEKPQKTKCCRRCKLHKPLDLFTLRANGRTEDRCVACRAAITANRSRPKLSVAEYKRLQRAKLAAAQGRKFRPGKTGRAPRSEEEKRILAIEAEERKRIARDARQAVQIATKPWLDPKLSAAESFRLRYRLDPVFNLKEKLRAAMRRRRQGIKLDTLLRGAIKRDGSSPRAEKFLGYRVPQLKAHLERQFKRGMSWQEFCSGDIHIDHIVPLSSFDLSNPDELRAAWSLTNLRPLWAKENLEKGAQRFHLI